MANDQQASFPICTLKMAINCCQKCPLKLERKLLKSNGVKSVTIDPDQGLVTVSGDIDPVLLLQTIKTMGKEAKLWFFQQEPDHDDKVIMCSKHAPKTEHGGIDSNSNNDDGKHFDWHLQHTSIPGTIAKKEHGWGSRSLPAMSSNVHGYSYSRSLPPLGYRPTWPYQQSVPGHRLTPPHGYYLQPPPPPAYPYFRPQSPPRTNPMVHYTSYADNYYSQV